jgi:hypothetical protein
LNFQLVGYPSGIGRFAGKKPVVPPNSELV